MNCATAALRTSYALATRFWQRLDELWVASQVSRCGVYSVARLQAFDEYCHTASVTRVVAVCLLSPLPSLLFPILLECIPLKAPQLGWDASWNLWIRCAITNTMLTANFITQARQVLPGLDISACRIGCVAVCTGVSFAGASMLVASQWMFPIPFAFVVTSAPFGCIAVFFFVVFVGTAPFKRIDGLRARLQRLWRMLAVQFTLITIYPLYSALFLWVSSQRQTLILSTLPVLKLGMKNLMAKIFTATELEDSIPEITVFSVEIFNSLYISACLQMASSAQLTTFFVIAIDVLQSIFMVHGVLKRAHEMRELLQHTAGNERLHASVFESCRQLRLADDMSEREQTRESERVSPTARRLQPPPPLQTTSAMPRRHWIQWLVLGRKRLRIVAPMSLLPPRPMLSSPRSKDKHSQIVKQTLAMLFNCEYFILVEYIECVIPIVYSTFTTALFHLPNAVFYPHVKSLTSENLASVTANLAMYTTLEVLSLLGMSLLLRWKLRISCVYLLAFVLETHQTVIQAKLFVWVTYSLTYDLEHAGTSRALAV